MEIIDLTHPIKEGMPTCAADWHIHPQIKQLGKIESVGRETRSMQFGSHAGTHVDAPKHFIQDGDSIDTVPLSTLIGPVTIVDFSSLEKNDSVSVDMLEKIEITERMIFKFGWDKNWSTDSFYKDYPFFTKEAAQHLISKGVKLIGLDTPSPDDSRAPFDGGQDDSPIHKMFLGSGVVLVEYIANLGSVSDYSGWNLIALPLKVADADGSPARVCIYR